MKIQAKPKTGPNGERVMEVKGRHVALGTGGLAGILSFVLYLHTNFLLPSALRETAAERLAAERLEELRDYVRREEFQSLSEQIKEMHELLLQIKLEVDR